MPSNSSAQKNKSNDKGQSTTVMLPPEMRRVLYGQELKDVVKINLTNQIHEEEPKDVVKINMPDSYQTSRTVGKGEQDMGF